VSDVRAQLRASVAASSAPYGFTLTVWGAGAVATSELGSPGLLGAFLLICGAVAGFVLVEAAAYGSLRIRPAEGEPSAMAIAGNAHIVSAGGAIAIVWVALQLVTTTAGWAVTGAAATAFYLVATALQTRLAQTAA
jgi:hypothetical protein